MVPDRLPNPILWHIMKYYAHFGHTEFILCLGHKQEVIKEYFLNYARRSSTTSSTPTAARRWT